MLIHCQQLQVTLSETPILNDVSFTLQTGDYLCIVGPNGSGKSTLLRCLNGIIKPSGGQLTIAGQAVQQYSQKHIARQISYVPQNTGRELPFTVEAFLRMARYVHQSFFSDWTPTDQAAVETALTITQCQAFRERQMRSLSGGECQRVMIAAAVAQDTPILLLDEPTSHLDPHHQVEVHRLIQRLNRDYGKTILEVSHDINHASLHAQQILALQAGRSIWQGAATNFLHPERLNALYQQAFIFLPHPQTRRTIALIDESASCR